MNIRVMFFGLIVLAYANPAVAIEPDWGDYARLLQENIVKKQYKGTRLNWVYYSQLKQSPVFEKVVKQLETFSPEALENRQQQLAFYINAYNILVMKMVLDHWPLKSIKEAGNFISPVWKKKAGRIGGKSVTLDEIEHKILRPMGEPRIHIAIVCASVSCPDLRREPYTGEKLNEQLDEQAGRFLLNAGKGLNIGDTEARTSKIFDWFEDDFISGYGSVENFIRLYADLPPGIKLSANLPYDWTLNGE
ncbi:MAG: DUF547 domain-containing protein [Gammaproteobacteria bacterium]